MQALGQPPPPPPAKRVRSRAEFTAVRVRHGTRVFNLAAGLVLHRNGHNPYEDGVGEAAAVLRTALGRRPTSLPELAREVGLHATRIAVEESVPPEAIPAAEVAGLGRLFIGPARFRDAVRLTLLSDGYTVDGVVVGGAMADLGLLLRRRIVSVAELAAASRHVDRGFEFADNHRRFAAFVDRGGFGVEEGPSPPATAAAVGGA